jgi:hypothetical protein
MEEGRVVGQVATNGSYLTPRMPNDNPTIPDLMQSIKLRFTQRIDRFFAPPLFGIQFYPVPFLKNFLCVRWLMRKESDIGSR